MGDVCGSGEAGRRGFLNRWTRCDVQLQCAVMCVCVSVGGGGDFPSDRLCVIRNYRVQSCMYVSVCGVWGGRGGGVGRGEEEFQSDGLCVIDNCWDA